MILDAIILIILIFPMAVGMYRGLIYMGVHMLSWAAAFAAAFIFSEPLAGILKDGSAYTVISDDLAEKFNSSADSMLIACDGLPDIISGGLKATAESASDMMAQMIASALISIISFLIIIFIVKLILRILLRTAANRESRSLLSKGDKLAGFAVGAAEGVFFVFLFLMILVPVVNFSGSDMSAYLVKSLDDSVIAGTLYDNNLLLLITGGIFS